MKVKQKYFLYVSPENVCFVFAAIFQIIQSIRMGM